MLPCGGLSISVTRLASPGGVQLALRVHSYMCSVGIES